MVASDSEADKSGSGRRGAGGAPRHGQAARGSHPGGAVRESPGDPARGPRPGDPARGSRPGDPVRGSRSGRPVMVLLDLLGRRWALRILWELRDGPVATFRELQQRCDNVSSSVLSQRVRELRSARILAETGFELTAAGKELLQVLGPVNEWATRWAGRR